MIIGAMMPSVQRAATSVVVFPLSALALQTPAGQGMSVGNGRLAAFAPPGAAIEACHLGVGAALVQKDQPVRLKLQLPVKPGLAGRLHIGAVLLCGVGGLFLTV